MTNLAHLTSRLLAASGSVGAAFGALGPFAIAVPLAAVVAARILEAQAAPPTTPAPRAPSRPDPVATTMRFHAGDVGVTYDDVLMPYLSGIDQATIVDPYLRDPEQVRNLRELVESISRATDHKPAAVHVITTEERSSDDQLTHLELLSAAQDHAALHGIMLSFSFSNTIHDREITTEHWEIQLGKGLDFWKRPQTPDEHNQYERQEFREVAKDFKVTTRTR